MSLAIFTDLIKAQAYSDQIHEWLKKNRKDYTAECWSKVDEGGADKVAEWYVKVPPDYEALNAKIVLTSDKLEVSKDAVRIVEKLPVDWKTVEVIE